MRTQSPPCLVRELQQYGFKATGDKLMDQAWLNTCKCRTEKGDIATFRNVHKQALRIKDEQSARLKALPDLADPEIYDLHYQFLMFVADEVVLKKQDRQFIEDEHNRDAIRFLLYYFHECPLALQVFPNYGYKLHKNLLIKGPVGTGKTALMKLFSEYTCRLQLPKAFRTISVTEMINYYSVNGNNLDLYTYNAKNNDGRPRPIAWCLNDVGMQDKTYFGMNTFKLTEEFLHARNEIWTDYDVCAHITTNLDEKALVRKFNEADVYGRIADRFKTYNVISVNGPSRR